MDLKNQAKGFWSSNGGTVLSVTSVLLSLVATGSAIVSTSKAIEDIKEAEQKKYEDYISKGPKDDSLYCDRRMSSRIHSVCCRSWYTQ